MKSHASMNRIYRLVWNAALGLWVAVAENATGRSKAGSCVNASGRAALGLLALLALAAPQAHAADAANAAVTAGSGTVVTNGNTTTINQSTARLVIDWTSLSTRANEALMFNQPNAQAIALNRITGTSPSELLGNLTANGQVFILNPNGVLFGAGSQVNVGGLVASTLHMRNADFMTGNYQFNSISGTLDKGDSVINHGNITAHGDNDQGGTIALIAAKITNTGTLTATGGNVLLGAGSQVLLDLGGPVKLQVTRGALNTLIEQGGAIRADGGRVYLTTAAAGDLASSVINHTGITQARTLATGEQGEIVLSSGHAIVNTGTLDVSAPASATTAAGNAGGSIRLSTVNLIDAGTLDASSASGQGGSVQINASGAVQQAAPSTWRADGAARGGSIRLQAGTTAWLSGHSSANALQGSGGAIALTAADLTLAGATLSATGESGGGRIRVGGGWQGKDADLPNAQRTRVVASTLDVSATQTGNGGTAVVWADGETVFGGAIRATGGTLSGDGGQVEVSAKGQLTYGGTVDAKAFHGHNGTLLLDPKNIEIVASAAVSGLSILPLPDPTPGANEEFGQTSGNVYVVELLNNGASTNRIVVASRFDSTVASQAGAVYLYNSTSGALLSTLTGSQANDQVGGDGITTLDNGNYVVSSSNWGNGGIASAGAVTWGNGSTGTNGVISASNSLVGSTAGDRVGSGVTALSNGNYVVRSSGWVNGCIASAGAATAGAVYLYNSTSGALLATLTGSQANDSVGGGGVTALSNGNYVVGSSGWDNAGIVNAGAVTWGNGSTGTSGVVSASNSLVGSTASDLSFGASITALTNGNYVLAASRWDNGSIVNAGAVTWGNGSTGTSGVISASNSLVGSTASDQVGSGVTALSNGNYVVRSSGWDNGSIVDAGAVTWGNGSAGTSGVIGASNSLVGSTASDTVGSTGVTALSNGNYVVGSQGWDNGSIVDASAATWGNGSTGTSGVVSASNSLVGSTANDAVGSNGVTALSNGNYVVGSQGWDNAGVVDVGAATWGNGSTGISGIISTSNSLVGSTAGDSVGGGVTALSNGNYVVRSSGWDNGSIVDAGAATWVNGSTGTTGVVSASNSLVGSTAFDQVGDSGVTALSNGNYVLAASRWDNGSIVNAGAVTWGNGSTGTSGVVSASNSLVGSTAHDQVGSDTPSVGSVTALRNGNYVVGSGIWDNAGIVNAGAVSLGNGSTGTSGVIGASNSLVGSTANDAVGSSGITALADGRALVRSGSYDQVSPALVNAGRIDILSLVTGTDTFTNPQSYATNASASNLFVAADILALLNAGTNVTLQANNDITLSTALVANNPGGNGGALTLTAGRSLLLNANITTDNANLTLTANDTAAHGVVNAQRDAGAASITMAAGTTINAGTSAVAITLGNGAGNTHNTAGTVTLASITAGSLSVDSSNFGGSFAASNKVVDGTTAATVGANTLSGLAFATGSNLTRSDITATFADANVGSGKVVTAAPMTLSGFNGATTGALMRNGVAWQPTSTADITTNTTNPAPVAVQAAITSATQNASQGGNAGTGGFAGDTSLGFTPPADDGNQRLSGGLALVNLTGALQPVLNTGAGQLGGFKKILVMNDGINSDESDNQPASTR